MVEEVEAERVGLDLLLGISTPSKDCENCMDERRSLEGDEDDPADDTGAPISASPP